MGAEGSGCSNSALRFEIRIEKFVRPTYIASFYVKSYMSASLASPNHFFYVYLHIYFVPIFVVVPHSVSVPMV